MLQRGGVWGKVVGALGFWGQGVESWVVQLRGWGIMRMTSKYQQ